MFNMSLTSNKNNNLIYIYIPNKNEQKNLKNTYYYNLKWLPHTLILILILIDDKARVSHLFIILMRENQQFNHSSILAHVILVNGYCFWWWSDISSLALILFFLERVHKNHDPSEIQHTKIFIQVSGTSTTARAKMQSLTLFNFSAYLV